jgi:leucyl aminopeptidase
VLEHLADGAAGQQIPIWMVSKDASLEALPLSPEQHAWIKRIGFKGTAKQQTLVPGPDGRIAGVLFGLGEGAAGEPSGPSELLIGQLAPSLPTGSYRLANDTRNATLAAIAWGLGHCHTRYKSNGTLRGKLPFARALTAICVTSRR